MKVAPLLILFSLVALCSAHTCDGTIINKTNITMLLYSSTITSGNIGLQPNSTIKPGESGIFQVTSDFGVDDIMRYTFEYQAKEAWCSGVSPTNVVFGASYEYDYGSNSCVSTNAFCDSGNDIIVTDQNCDGAWAYSNPIFYVEFGEP